VEHTIIISQLAKYPRVKALAHILAIIAKSDEKMLTSYATKKAVAISPNLRMVKTPQPISDLIVANPDKNRPVVSITVKRKIINQISQSES